MEENKGMPPIYIVSGGKGVAGHTIVETMLIQYPNNRIPLIMEPEIRTDEQVEEITYKAVESKGAVAHTMVDHHMRKKLTDACNQKNIPHCALVGDLFDYLDKTLDIRPVDQPGL